MLKREYAVARACGIKEFLKSDVGLSSSFLKKTKYGHIFVNGAAVHMRAELQAGDVVTVEYPDENSENILPVEQLPDVLYEDDDILAVNKPCGMPIHPSRGNHLPTLAGSVKYYFGDKPFVFRAVGRLDRDTSGIVVLAKTQTAAYQLSRAMQAGTYYKEYTAITVKAPAPPFGIVDAPIERLSPDGMMRGVCEGGKPSVTDYSLLGVAPSGHALIKLVLHTGRTHQIRVHMAHIGCPLLGDFLYGERIEGETYRLHAARISFPHPTDGHTVEISCPAPFLTEESFS